MKEKIINALKTRYKNLGLGEKAFDGVAAFLEPSITEEGEIETAVAGVESMLKAFQADSDKVRTGKTAAEKKLAELEAKVAELGGAPVKTEPEQVNNDTPAWAKDLIESNKSLSERLASMEGEKVVTSRKQQINAIVEKLPESLRKPYDRMSVKDLSNEEFENLTEEIKTDVDAMIKDANAKGAVFGKPLTNGTTTSQTEVQATTEEVDDVVSKMNI